MSTTLNTHLAEASPELVFTYFFVGALILIGAVHLFLLVVKLITKLFEDEGFTVSFKQVAISLLIGGVIMGVWVYSTHSQEAPPPSPKTTPSFGESPVGEPDRQRETPSTPVGRVIPAWLAFFEPGQLEMLSLVGGKTLLTLLKLMMKKSEKNTVGELVKKHFARLVKLGKPKPGSSIHKLEYSSTSDLNTHAA